MGSTPNDRQLKLMDYLYGDLSLAEKREMEAYFKKDPDLLKELEDFRGIRKRLGEVRDGKVPDPVLLPAASPPRFWQEPFFRYAATLTLFLSCLMLVGKFTGLSLQSGDSGFAVAFREMDMLEANRKAERRDLATTLAEVMEEKLEMREKTLESKLEQKFLEQGEDWQKQLQGHRSSTEEAILAMVQELHRQDQIKAATFRSDLAASQNEFFTVLMEDLSLALQQMREEELLYLQAWMAGLESDKAAFQQETEKILAGLLHTVGNFQHE